MTTMKDIRERDARIGDASGIGLCVDHADRRHLLNLVERMRPYVEIASAMIVYGEQRKQLDALLEELKSE